MPSHQPKPTFTRHSPPVREGSAPFGHYWGLPVITALSMVCVCLALLMPAGPARRIVAPLTGAAVLAAAVLHTVRERRWERESQRRRFVVVEWLIDLMTPMGTDEGSESVTLQKLPDAIRTLLGMNKSYVSLLVDGGKAMHVLASAGIDPSPDGMRLPMTELPLTRRCIETKDIVDIADLLHPGETVNALLARQMKFRAIVLVPMVYQDEVLGIIVLGDDRPRALTEMDRRRVRFWGYLAAVLLAHSRLYSQMSRTLENQKLLLEHRNALYDLNTAIQRTGSLDEVLQRIVELAPGPLEVDVALIWMVNDDDPSELVVKAVTTPFDAKAIGLRIPIRGSRAEGAATQGNPVIVEDGTADPLLKPHIKAILPYGSMVFEPMQRGDGRLLGLLVLIRHLPGTFRADQLELARLFSQRAAAVIEMAHLHERARADADAKAMLLRELNHRVKNNLAGIISLLSIHQPELSRDARRWLDRVIERIGAMAQAHDLFNAGPQRVTLDELVERTIRTLSVVKPAGVTVRTDLVSANARLRTERAVSLAMAMHELCFNGIVHGLGETGTLTIRARRDNGHLSLEIEDDSGDGRPAQMPIEPSPQPGDRVGIGLNLVRGLVGRELHGKFELGPAPGGARATVQFPLLPDELTGPVI